MPLAPTHPKTLEENVSTFRRVCGQWATGVAIATSYYQGTVHACTVSSVQPLSSEPLLISISLRKAATMAEFLMQSHSLGISILRSSQEAQARQFSGQAARTFPFEWRVGPDQTVPLIPGALAYLVGDLIQIVETGDHLLFIATVRHCLSDDEGSPLLHFRGRFSTLAAEWSGSVQKPDAPSLDERRVLVPTER